MNKFLSEVKGFTPVIDALVTELGPIPAIVYGVVWRFCQMDDHVCRATLDTIARRAGVSYRTALTHVKALCDAGYLEDTTPDRRNAPHVYKDTGHVQIIGLVEARFVPDDDGNDDVTTCNDSDAAMQQMQSAMQNLQSHYAADADEESIIKKEEKRKHHPSSLAEASSDTGALCAPVNDDDSFASQEDPDAYSFLLLKFEKVLKRKPTGRDKSELRKALDRESGSYVEPWYISAGIETAYKNEGRTMLYVLNCAETARQDDQWPKVPGFKHPDGSGQVVKEPKWQRPNPYPCKDGMYTMPVAGGKPSKRKSDGLGGAVFIDNDGKPRNGYGPPKERWYNTLARCWFVRDANGDYHLEETPVAEQG